MQPNMFTLKSQEAIAAAQSLGATRNQQTAEPERLLHGLLTDPEGDHVEVDAAGDGLSFRRA